MNENLADEIRKTIESIKDMKTQASGINNYLSILEGMMRADIQKKVDEAYQRGYDKGYADKTNNDEVCKKLAKDIQVEAYQRGLDDAWEAAKKLFSSMADSDIEKAFPTEWNNGGFNALMNLQPQVAIEKLKAYEEKQKADDKIKVGDEVDCSGDSFIVTRIFHAITSKVECDGVDMDGCTYHDVLISGLTKTGRHVDITDMLKGALE